MQNLANPNSNRTFSGQQNSLSVGKIEKLGMTFGFLRCLHGVPIRKFHLIWLKEALKSHA
jgi:hypothetical protein